MATTTPNFGWAVPTSTDLVKDGAVAIETLGDSIDASLVDLKGGTTGQVLAKASGTDMDFAWVSDATGMTNPMTTTGDVIYSSSGSTPDRLGIGTAGQVLTVNSGATAPEWATPASSSPTFVGCAIFGTGTQSISNATQTAITWNSESFDTDAFHSTSTNTSRITIPAGKAGKYLISGLIEVSNTTTGSWQLSIYKNGSITRGFILDASDVFPSAQLSHVLDLVATDYVEIFIWQNSGTSQTIYLDAYAAASASFLGA